MPILPLRVVHQASAIIHAPDRSFPTLMNRRQHPVTLLQASQDSPVLAQLAGLTRDSVARLKSVESLIPMALRSAIQAGPIEGTVWCLILNNNAAAAKIRQLLPALESHLRAHGWEVTAIRLKVHIPDRR